MRDRGAALAALHDELAAAMHHDVQEVNERRLAEVLLRAACRHRASDIHLDPSSLGTLVRMRVDGVLHDAALVSAEDAPRLLNQLKVLAGIDPMTVFHPEEARWSQCIDGRELGLRLTVVPCLRGPKLALRILDRDRIEMDLRELGIAQAELERIETWLAEMNGMVVCAGPTGSGKTTTLYAILREAADQHRHIITVEDPPDYALDGINQIAVDPRHGVDFASGLRAILRTDPDYLMLGEVRDGASAQVLVEAANAGRVALTSMHTRDAIGVVTQLRNWQIPDHVIAATTSLVIAQRLARRLCPACRRQIDPGTTQRRWLADRGLPVPATCWGPVGCEACDGIGYRGRCGLFEIWAIGAEAAEAIRAGADEARLRDIRGRSGQRRLVDHGLERVEQGEIGLDELRASAVPLVVDPG